VEIKISIKTKSGKEINLDYEEGLEVFNQLKQIYEKNIAYPAYPVYPQYPTWPIYHTITWTSDDNPK